MNIDWGKTFKKAGITIAQAVVGLVVGLPITIKLMEFSAKFGVTPEQIAAIEANAVILLSGLIAGSLEFIRSWIKQRFNLSWL